MGEKAVIVVELDIDPATATIDVLSETVAHLQAHTPEIVGVTGYRLHLGTRDVAHAVIDAFRPEIPITGED